MSGKIKLICPVAGHVLVRCLSGDPDFGQNPPSDVLGVARLETRDRLNNQNLTGEANR
jgi:hypothetical protein